MKRDIFRASALARMSSPEQLDQLLRVTTSKSWIALLGIGLVLGTAVVWGFEGRIATKTGGKGVVLRTGNLLTVGTLASGEVATLNVRVGDQVTKGEVIASVGQPSLLGKIRETTAQIQDAEAGGTRTKGVRAEGIKLEMATLEKQRATFEQQIKSLQEEEKNVADQVPVNEELYAKGLVTKQQVLGLHERLASIENNIGNINAQIVGLNSSEYKLENTGREADVDGESRVVDLKRNLRLLEDDLALNTKVVSPYSGQVIEVQAVAGSLVGAGSPIITLQPDARDVEVVAYIPASNSKEVKPGMAVEIIPSSVRPEEYGFIRGVVISVADYPSTDASLMRVFQNNSLAQSLEAGGPVTEVHVEMNKNPSTFSGFEWSSGKGAPIHITPGTICAAQVITREQQPVTMVLPYIKTKVGIY
jgi:HlyD family secretion protein